MGIGMDDTADISENDTGVTKGTALDHFVEIDEILQLINNIPQMVTDQISKEISDEKFTEIVDKYLQQPHLLDPYLDVLLQSLLGFVQDKNAPTEQVHSAFKYLYLLTKVRGPKLMIRKFPHEVADLEPVLNLLSEQSLEDQESWETRYMLLLWLSMICLIPFDMVRFDTPNSDGSESKQSVTSRILDFGKLYLTTSSDNCQEASVLLLSKFITRPDISKVHMAGFVKWCLLKITSSDPELMVGLTQIKGCLSVLAMMFKQGKRDGLLSFTTPVLEKVQESGMLNVKNMVIRKLVVKLVQRVGMTLLRPRVAAWRYQRGSRSLDETLKQSSTSPAVPQLASSKAEDDDDDESYDIPEDIETILEIVLNGLKDKDTIVRWSAAKGVGRITSRLPKDLADEVVGSVLENFSVTESDGAWHGGCLSLAELGRRGLLLPERLSDVVPILLKALTYDERRGASSVGSHVRDAACYLAWSFARAYAPETLNPYVKSIAQTLLITTVFDREVNCRRAASAAFQENVGRQGHFPHGIVILTLADYFAVSNRTNTYLNIGPTIAGYKEYTLPLIRNLATQKRDHWDNSIRWLAAQAMHKLTKKAPDFVAADVLGELVPLCTGMDLITRHGSILIVAEIVHSLHELEQEGSFGLISTNPQLKSILRIVRGLSDAKLFRGFGGELMRVAACHLIARISQCNDTIMVPKLINESWLELIHVTLSNLHTYTNAEEICSTAINALSSINKVTLVADAYKSLSPNDNKNSLEAVEQYLSHLSSEKERERCGYAQAIASLPKPIIQNCFMKVCHGLIKATKVNEKFDVSFAEARRDAVKALSRVCGTVGLSPDNNLNSGVCADNVGIIYDALLNALSDYTRDRRGDIGSAVREAGIKALLDVTTLLAKLDNILLAPQLVTQVMCGIVQQACEKIHKVRDFAASAFVKLLYNDQVPHVARRSELQQVFESRSSPHTMVHLFDKLSKLLAIDTYAYHVLLGLIASVGDLTQSLAEASGDALFAYMDSIQDKPERLEKFCSILIEVFRNHSKQDRVSVPLLKTLQQLLSQGSFTPLVDANDSNPRVLQFQKDLLELVKLEVFKNRDAQKLLVCINVYCGLLQFQCKEFRKSVLSQLMVMLCHRFPVVRRTAASQLYETILTYDDLCPPDDMDLVITNLSEVEWDQPVDGLKPVRNQLCSYFDVPVPRVVKKTA